MFELPRAELLGPFDLGEINSSSVIIPLALLRKTGFRVSVDLHGSANALPPVSENCEALEFVR